jgi:hypothetical protein
MMRIRRTGLPKTSALALVAFLASSSSESPLLARPSQQETPLAGGLEVLRLRPNFYVIAGAGGHIGDALRIVEITETVSAIVLLAGCQAAELRGGNLPPRLAKLLGAVRREVPGLEADRRQDLDIERVLALHRSGALRI